MDHLKLKGNITKEEARRHPTPGLVYNCPKCGVGHALTHEGRDKMRCNICKGIYLKP